MQTLSFSLLNVRIATKTEAMSILVCYCKTQNVSRIMKKFTAATDHSMHYPPPLLPYNQNQNLNKFRCKTEVLQNDVTAHRAPSKAKFLSYNIKLYPKILYPRNVKLMHLQYSSVLLHRQVRSGCETAHQLNSDKIPVYKVWHHDQLGNIGGLHFQSRYSACTVLRIHTFVTF